MQVSICVEPLFPQMPVAHFRFTSAFRQGFNDSLAAPNRCVVQTASCATGGKGTRNSVAPVRSVFWPAAGGTLPRVTLNLFAAARSLEVTWEIPSSSMAPTPARFLGRPPGGLQQTVKLVHGLWEKCVCQEQGGKKAELKSNQGSKPNRARAPPPASRRAHRRSGSNSGAAGRSCSWANPPTSRKPAP